MKTVAGARGGRSSPPRDPDDRLARLLEAKARFLRFLERRLGDRSAAEDLLQTALLRLLDRGGGPRDDDKLVPWFYQVLRNLLLDHYRRGAARERMRTALAAERVETAAFDRDLLEATCACVGGLAATLRPAYAEVIRLVEVEEEPPADVARRLGLAPNALAVRLHRARRALRDAVLATCRACATHGCLDCSCRPGRAGEPATVIPEAQVRLPGRARRRRRATP